jgi:hypothetical protein
MKISKYKSVLKETEPEKKAFVPEHVIDKAMDSIFNTGAIVPLSRIAEILDSLADFVSDEMMDREKVLGANSLEARKYEKAYKALDTAYKIIKALEKE